MIKKLNLKKKAPIFEIPNDTSLILHCPLGHKVEQIEKVTVAPIQLILTKFYTVETTTKRNHYLPCCRFQIHISAFTGECCLHTKEERTGVSVMILGRELVGQLCVVARVTVVKYTLPCQIHLKYQMSITMNTFLINLQTTSCLRSLCFDHKDGFVTEPIQCHMILSVLSHYLWTEVNLLKLSFLKFVSTQQSLSLGKKYSTKSFISTKVTLKNYDHIPVTVQGILRHFLTNILCLHHEKVLKWSHQGPLNNLRLISHPSLPAALLLNKEDDFGNAVINALEYSSDKQISHISNKKVLAIFRY